jgi:hypothetical protein
MLKNITKALHQVFDVHYRSNDSWLEEILKQNKVLSLNISSHNHSKKNKGNLTNYTSLTLQTCDALQTCDKFEQGQKWKQMLISLTIKA